MENKGIWCTHTHNIYYTYYIIIKHLLFQLAIESHGFYLGVAIFCIQNGNNEYTVWIQTRESLE